MLLAMNTGYITQRLLITADGTSSSNEVSSAISSVPDIKAPARLEPIKNVKGNRLPPLKNNRLLPGLNPIHSDNKTNGRPTPLSTLARSDVSIGKSDNDHVTACSSPKPPESSSRSAIEPTQKDTECVKVPEYSHAAINKSYPLRVNKDTKTPVPPPASKIMPESVNKHTEKLHRGKQPVPKLLPEPDVSRSNTKLAKLIQQDSTVDCRKERELLRLHRKQQAERLKLSRQPMKPTQAYDSLGKEVRNKPSTHDTLKKVAPREVKKIDLSIRRKCDDDDDWDWDKDIEDYLELEKRGQSESQSTSGEYSNIQNGGSRLHAHSPSVSCSKRGVGFKSKKRLEEERLAVLAREEEDRLKQLKEKERVEMMIPQKIKKDLKKYGFK
ncbi:hypothetical protein ACF0H5_015326 [Mactra antiquata]